MRPSDTILFAVLGMTPAVLTETVWALSRRKPAIIPDRVVVLTTTFGKKRIQEELLASGVWKKLQQKLKTGDRLAFGDTSRHLVVFSHRGEELDDLRTAEDNLAAGDCILEELRKFTTDPTKRVIASLAGGRKTMSALMYAAMTLLGRDTDLMTHVLVPEKYERAKPPFYFPTKASENDVVELADIPFVPLGNRFRELGELPGGFRALVAHYSRALRAETPAEVSLTDTGLIVNGTAVALPHRVRLTAHFLIDLNQRNTPLPLQSDAEAPFKAFLQKHDATWANALTHPEDLKRCLSDLRKHLQRAGLVWMPGMRRDSLRLPPFTLT